MSHESSTTNSGSGPWRIRIVAYRLMPVSEIIDNPKAWRKHPEKQRNALRAALDHVGLVKPLIYNERTNRLVDGAARLDLARRDGQEMLPVIIVDLSEEEEALVLATLDPLSELAEVDTEALQRLLQEVSVDDVTLMELLTEIGADAGLEGFADLAASTDHLLGTGSGEPQTAAGDDRSDGAGGEDGEGDRSATLRLLEVTIADPRHEVKVGDVWRLGEKHVLICLSVVDAWPQWVHHLDQDNAALCPFPGPFVPLAAQAAERKLVLVQPDPYLAGHLLDRYADVHGDAAVVLEARL